MRNKTLYTGPEMNPFIILMVERWRFYKGSNIFLIPSKKEGEKKNENAILVFSLKVLSIQSQTPRCPSPLALLVSAASYKNA